MTPGSTIVPLCVAVPLTCAFLIALLGKRVARLPDVLGFLATLCTCGLSLGSVWLVNSAGVIEYPLGGWDPPLGISMVLDGLTAFMLVTVNVVALLVALFSIDYMERFTAKWQFYTLFLLMPQVMRLRYTIMLLPMSS